MKTYHKHPPKPKKKKIDHTPTKKSGGSRNKIATLASTLYLKVTSAFSPLNDFQKALCYTGKDSISKTKQKKPSLVAAWYKKNQIAFAVIERILFFAFVIFALFTNPFLLLILPAMGTLVFYRARVQWLWWKFKIYVLFRGFYEHRRNLYKQGTLLHHFKTKKPKIYKKAIIWGESANVQETKFNALKNKNKLTTKEYIHS